MTQFFGLLISLETLVGAAFVVFYALDRFGKPPAEPGGRPLTCPSRATTTAAAYYTALVLYCSVGLAVYMALLVSPKLLGTLRHLAPEAAGLVPNMLWQSPTVLVALLLTVLLPKVPVLASVDVFFRTRLQHMAAIPHEVRRLAADLRRAPFRSPAEAERRELTAALVAKGFDPADLHFDGGASPHALWTRLATLVRRLEAWDADSQLQEYFLSCPGELATLRERYREMLPKAQRCFSLSRDLAAERPDQRAATALVAYREDVTNQMEALLGALHDAIGRAVLLCDVTYHRRARRLLGLGFEMTVEPVRHISLHSLMLLFTAGSVLFTAVFLVAPHLRSGESTMDLLLRSVMIAAIYCVALWCAIAPKSRWLGARRHPGGPRPWGAYLACAIVAAVASIVVNFITKLLALDGLATAWERTREGTPWAIMSFAVAYGVAALADDEADDLAIARLAPHRLWLVEGLVMVAAMLPVALFVHLLLQQTTPPDRVRAVWLILPTTAVVAFALGALVPTWYRDSPRTMASPRLAPVPADAGAR